MSSRSDFYYSGIQTTRLYKKSPWRKIRDLFDDTIVSSPRRKESRIKEYVLNKQKEIFQEKEKKYIPANSIEDYSIIPTENSDVFIPEIVEIQQVPAVVHKPILMPVPKVRIITRDVFISVPKIVRKDYKITLPRVKINMTNLRKLGWLSLIFTCIVTSFFTAFLFYTGMNFFDGNYIGETYRYKMAEFERQLVVPLAAKVDRIESKQLELDAKEDARLYREFAGIKPERPRTYMIKDAATGKLLRVEVK